jgi:hypothetical protein
VAQVRSASSSSAPAAPAHAVRVAVLAPRALGATAIASLRARGIDARPLLGDDDSARNDERGIDFEALAAAAEHDVLACALSAPPTAADAVELGKLCERAALAGRPVCLLAPAQSGTGRVAIERAAALAYVRARGAALGHDADAWLEAIVALVRFGLPAGPRAAVIAPAGSWLEAQAHALATEPLADGAGTRSPLSNPDEPTDVALYDPVLGHADLQLPARERAGGPPLPVLLVPVAARAELADDRAVLFGARAALGAVAMLGRAAERIAVGLGPAPSSASAELGIDADKLARQLAKLAGDRQLGRHDDDRQLGRHDGPARRLGDHETKVLLSAYGVPITRQAVATTPSAAVKLARRAGFPVELKPWGADVPTEPAGAPVERGISSDALVRQAFTAVLSAAGKLGTDGAAVIVRETPPPGRDVSVAFVDLPALGWTVILDAPCAIVAAPAPLRLVDAQSLAAAVVASRAGDPDPDRIGLANLLRRASHLVVDLAAHITRLDLPRVLVGGRGARTLVVDAAAELH